MKHINRKKVIYIVLAVVVILVLVMLLRKQPLKEYYGDKFAYTLADEFNKNIKSYTDYLNTLIKLKNKNTNLINKKVYNDLMSLQFVTEQDILELIQ